MDAIIQPSALNSLRVHRRFSSGRCGLVGSAISARDPILSFLLRVVPIPMFAEKWQLMRSDDGWVVFCQNCTITQLLRVLAGSA